MYENLKNDFFLHILFNHLERKKLLYIIKYNKKLKKRMNININDYKEFSEKYSSIEIEIKPADNKYGKFINFEKENEKYYHIYFNNNNKEEIKRNYINKDEQIKLIKIIIDYQVESFYDLFENCICIESIDFKKFNRNNINYMNSMFFECSSLKELNLNNFKTDNVTHMGSMFSGCSSLKELNLNNFNTSKVTNMNYMFYECSSLKELNLSNFNTNNVKYMNAMFSGCSSLNELNLKNFNTNNVSYINFMFFGCSDELILKLKTQYKNIKQEAIENH